MWVQCPDHILSVFGAMCLYGCNIGNSSCVFVAAASQLKAIGLPAPVCTEHLYIAMRVNTDLTQIHTPRVNEAKQFSIVSFTQAEHTTTTKYKHVLKLIPPCVYEPQLLTTWPK